MRSTLVILAALAGACDLSEPASLRTPVVDTLAGGIVRVTNPGPTAWLDTNGWKLTENLKITGTDSGPGDLQNPWMLAVDRMGRIYVSDNTIKLYAADGHFIRTVGRGGAGPGEYRSAMIATAGNTLLVQDPNLGRLTVFDSTGRFRKTWPTTCCTISPPSYDAGGGVTVWTNTGAGKNRRVYVRYDLNGATLDSLELPADPERKVWSIKTGAGGFWPAIPFSPFRSVAFPFPGGIVHGWPAEYTIIWTRTGRDTAMIFGRAWTPSPISKSRRNAAVRKVIEFATRNGRNFGGVDSVDLYHQVRLEQVPKTAPAYTTLAVDGGGNIWVETDPGDDSLHTHYDIFDHRGIYLGPVVAPTVFKGGGSTVWTADAVYTIQQAKDAPVIIRYIIERRR